MEEQNQFQFYLIRHGQSQHNLNMEKFYNEGIRPHQSKEMYNMKFSPQFADASITELGQKQAQKAAEQMKNNDIKYVIVSPLQRALQTCDIIFKNHKNKEQIKFIVHPFFREICLSSCDFGNKIEELQEQYKYMDFSKMEFSQNKQLWILDESAKFSENSKKLKKEIEESGIKDHDKQSEYFLNHIKQIYPEQIESQQNLAQRVQVIKQEILKIKQQYNIQNQELAIVGHGYTFRYLTAENFNDDFSPINSKGFQNCEIYQHQL